MTRLLLSGACGKMGRTLSSLIASRDDCCVVAGVDALGGEENTFPVFSSFSACSVAADVIIDFSHPSQLSSLLDYALTAHTPIVVCTTGFTAEQIEQIHQASSMLPIFFSANMSLGVNLMAALCEKAAAVLGNDFDIEIIERHHNQKIDAPSGTALMLANRISAVLPEEPQYVYDRHSMRQKRRKNEIGIHAVRGGTIVGEHEVLFAGTDETLSIIHTATSKQVFATGAINAALFLAAGKKNGLYDMRALV